MAFLDLDNCHLGQGGEVTRRGYSCNRLNANFCAFFLLVAIHLDKFSCKFIQLTRSEIDLAMLSVVFGQFNC